MRPLPSIMVAPNGARLTKDDHAGVPVTIPEIVACAVECQAAGADGMHAHVRNGAQKHVLDAGLYRELLAELDRALPGFYVQVTTEAVGRYSPDEQKALVRALRPQAVSIALREITAGQDDGATHRFFAECHEAGIGVQHILYDSGDVERLCGLVAAGLIPQAGLMTLIVLGRYTPGQVSTPADLGPPSAALLGRLPAVDWAVCAFGSQETACLLEARRLGGKARIGFENNRTNADLTEAASNAERVAELVAAWHQQTPLDDAS